MAARFAKSPNDPRSFILSSLDFRFAVLLPKYCLMHSHLRHILAVLKYLLWYFTSGHRSSIRTTEFLRVAFMCCTIDQRTA